MTDNAQSLIGTGTKKTLFEAIFVLCFRFSWILPRYLDPVFLSRHGTRTLTLYRTLSSPQAPHREAALVIFFWFLYFAEYGNVLPAMTLPAARTRFAAV